MYSKVNSLIPRHVEGTRIKGRKSKKATVSRIFRKRLPNERKNHSRMCDISATGNIYIYIYIPPQRQENIFPSSIRFPSTSNRMELERSLVHSTLEKWKIRFLKNVASCASFYAIIYYREKKKEECHLPKETSVRVQSLASNNLTNIHRYFARLAKIFQNISR